MAAAEYIHDGIRVVGSSFAGEETFLVLPEFDVAFDVGRCPREVLPINHVFLSHGHMDHAAGLAYYFSQRMFIDNAPGRLWAPEPLIEPIRRLLRVWADIDGHAPPAELHVATPGEDVPYRRGTVVRPFEVNHACRRHDRTVVRSLGFAVIDVRQKLRDEFADKPGPELVKLKAQGIEITRRVEFPLVAYCGDTAPGAFFELDFVRNARVLLLECTFIEPDHRDRAAAGAHMHVSDLQRVLPLLRNECILLTHLSRRTGLGDARAALREVLGELYTPRISFLMEHRRRRARGNESREL